MWGHQALTSALDRPAKTRALIAIAFTGSMLTSQLPALCQQPPANSSATTTTTTSSSPSSSSSVIESITKSVRGTPEEKAYYLLQLAYGYITGGNAVALETQLKAGLGRLGNSNIFLFSPRGEHLLVSWANSVSLLSHSAGAITPNEIGKKKISSENLTAADRAIEAAIVQLGQGAKNIKTLNFYLVASGLSRMTGNIPNVQKCTKVLNDAIQACEADENSDSSQIKLISSILDSMSYGLVPIRIPDYQALSPVQPSEIDMKDFDESERLKLRAAALLDRLPAGDQERRKVHRDLSLWYSQLGRDDKALKEKEKLFNLVGVKDDRILYPQSGVCGHLVWWKAEPIRSTMLCGMG